MQPSGSVDVRQEVVKEFEIALAIKDHHWQPVWIFRSADHAGHVLRNDVLQKRGLAGAGHAQHDALHDADSVRPVPRFAMDVVAENHGVLLPGFGRKLFVPFAGTTIGGWGHCFSRRERAVAINMAEPAMAKPPRA